MTAAHTSKVAVALEGTLEALRFLERRPKPFIHKGSEPGAHNVASARRLRRQIESFPGVARRFLGGSAGLACLAWWAGPSGVGLALMSWSFLALVRVPRRALLIEQSAVAAVATGVSGGPTVGVIVAVTLVCLVRFAVLPHRPEVGTRRFVGFDLCHILLTSAARPCTTHHFLDLTAPLHRERLVDALAWLIRDVDRLRSFVREAPFGIERFVAPALWVAPETLVEWSDAPRDPGESEWFERSFDLATKPAIALFHAPNGHGGYRFGLTLHHSIADGTGAMELLSGLLRRYDRLRGLPVAIPIIISDGPRCRRLARRLRLSQLFRLVLGGLHSPRGLRSASLSIDDTPRPARFAVRVLDLSDGASRRLRAAATHGRHTPNQLLIAASIRAAACIRKARGLPDSTFRVLLPTDLRSPFGLPRSLPNYIGTVSVAVQPEEVGLASLPSIIRQEIADGRSLETQLRFPLQIGVLGALLPPAVARGALRRFDQAPDTFAFSYLFSHIRVPRELHVPAGMAVTRLWCASAQGRQPGFGIVVTTLHERTSVALQYLVPYVSHETAEAFEWAFEREILALVPSSGGPACESA